MNKKKLIYLIIVIITATLIGICTFIYKNMMINLNTKKYEKYLLKNKYTKNKDNSYTKTIINKGEIINYYYIKEQSILMKETNSNINNNITTFNFTYSKDNIISSKYTITGLTKGNSYGTSVQTGKYDVNKKTFSCEIIISNNFESKCNELKQKSKEFSKEIKNILSNNNIKQKYIE